MNLYDTYVKSYNITEETESEFFDAIRDVFELKEVQSQKQYIQHADINRLQHMMSVSFMSYTFLKEHGGDYKSTARATMLHDLVYYDWHEAGDGSHRLHGYRHPGFALKNAEKICTLSPLEKNIILRHMWPLTIIPPKYKEGFIVTLFDKYCATQEILIYKSKKYSKKFHNDIINKKKRA